MIARIAEHGHLPDDLDPEYVARHRAWMASNRGSAAAPAHAATGKITTVAGTGQAGFAGDGGPATAAKLSFRWPP